jgi:hypothetical protein
MLISVSKRIAMLVGLLVLLYGASAPASAQQPRPMVRTSFILCGPGLVYRCNRYGCFCVRP